MNEQKNKKGKIVIVSGPSGVGKSTICREAVKRLNQVTLSVSVTTRPQTPTEVDGEDYWFISKEQFQQKIDDDMLLEYAEVFGNFYGTPKDKVLQLIEDGQTVILEIDVQGARKVKTEYPEAKMIFIMPPSKKHLKQRMNDRGREDLNTAEKRLSKAGTEIAAAWQYYENMVINDNLQQAVEEVVQIIEQSIGEQI